MVKIAAIIMVIVSTTLMGFLLAGRYKQRVRELRIIYGALKHVETEIVYGLTPLPQAFYNISCRVEQPLQEVFSYMSEKFSDHELSTVEIWQSSWMKYQDRMALKKGDYEILFQLGHSLGQSDKENQMKHIAIALTYLQTEEEGARQEQQKHEKMYQYLGFLTGVMIIILMI